MPFTYDFSFADGPGPWYTWMAPSVQSEAGGTVNAYTRYNLPGDLDPNHLDGIGPIWLLSHLSLPTFGAPGALNLADAKIDITIRSQDLVTNGAQLAFWIIRYLPDGQAVEQFVSALQSTNWAYTGGNFIDEVGEEWSTISVTLSDDPAGWTYAGNNHSGQGDWAERYVDYALAETIGAVDATLHLVLIGESPDKAPTGFLDIANISVTTQTEAVPIASYDYAAVLHAREDEALSGTLTLPQGIDASSAYFSVSGTPSHGTLVLDAATGAFTFTPEANFWGPNRDGQFASFHYIVSDANGTTIQQSAYVYVAPINDTPTAYAGNEDLILEFNTKASFTLRKGTDADRGERLTYELEAGSLNNVSISLDAATGQYVVSPDVGFSGEASFAYRVSDGQAQSGIKTVTITVLESGQDRVLPGIDALSQAFLAGGSRDDFLQGLIQLAYDGDRNAAYSYANFLTGGDGVTLNLPLAATQYQRAVGLVPDAALQLAMLYISGSGVTRDYANALTLLETIPNDPAAIYQRAVLHDLGFGTPADSALAADLYLQAALLGNADAMYTLGRRYLNGEGVPALPAEAFFWLGVGLKFGGGPEIVQFSDLITANMATAAVALRVEDVARLETAIQDWVPGTPLPQNPTLTARSDNIGSVNELNAIEAVAGTLFVNDQTAPGLSQLAVVAVNGDETLVGAAALGAYGHLTLFSDGSYRYVADSEALIEGESRTDTFSYTISDTSGLTSSAMVTVLVHGQSGTVQAGSGTLFGSKLSDRLQGAATPDILLGYDGDDILVGGDGDDVLAAGAGNDVLEGGSGANELIGSIGDDVYIIEEHSSSAIELMGEGTDEIRTSLSTFALQRNVENLTLTGDGVHGAGIGNELDNIIRGGAGRDDLFGREGNDILVGGTRDANSLFGQGGDDVYVVEVLGDSVFELSDQGIDTVITALDSFVLPHDVENLLFSGSGNFTGIGSNDDNFIIGDAGQDFLDGADGNDSLAGKGGGDTLVGGNGSDQFLYFGGETSFDRILDFTSGQDLITLSIDGFARTTEIDLIQSSAPAPTSANSAFLYNNHSGQLSYDSDGDGAMAAVALAFLNPGLVLADRDFAFF